MPMFRKKPVVIDAMQFDGSEKSFQAIQAWAHAGRDPVMNPIVKCYANRTFFVQTLEGPLLASNGDWIIKGVRGELNPCKPGIFAATYEPA